MDRNASAAFKTELALAANQPVHLIKVIFDAVSVCMTDAYKTVTYDGDDYLPFGYFLGFSNIEESAQLQVARMTLSLSGVDQSLISLFLNESYIDRTVYIYAALLSMANDSLVSDPVLVFDGQMDQPSIEEDPTTGTCTVSVICTNAWADFESRAGRHTNHQEQQLHFPGDMGFEFASEVVKDIMWGRTS